MTPEEKAAEIAADPAWGFAEDPTRAITHCSTRAASAGSSTGAQYRTLRPSERITQSRYWARVGLALCALAEREPGQVLANLRDRQ